MKHIVIVSKDILCTRYLPTYGNRHYKTPNIDELAAKGTVFKRHYTAAPSTAMAFTSMFTGKYPLETGRADYTEIEKFDIDGGTTLFDELDKKGYECHLVWSKNYIVMAERFSRCYGKNTIHHEFMNFNQYVGPHVSGLGDIERDDALLEETYNALISEIDTIDRSKPVFLWVHLPHVIKGRCGYGDDIDVLDRFVGDIRERFGDYIFITADHGNNDGTCGKTGYGFDVFESAIHIPLIAPRLEGKEVYEGLTSNIDLMEFILNEKIPEHEYVLSDTSYFQQPLRKFAIVKGNYKLVYDKLKKKKYLYDVIEDPEEKINLLNRITDDPDRYRKVVTKQTIYYPYWDKVDEAYKELNAVFESLWDNGKTILNIKNYIVKKMRYFLSTLKGKYKVLMKKS